MTTKDETDQPATSDHRWPLELGEWEPVGEITDQSKLHISVQCQRTGDVVDAFVEIGSLGDGDREDYGLPSESEVPLNDIWYLHRLSPRRNRRAIGGTTTLLRHLLELADGAGAWVVTGVITIAGNDDEVITFLKVHGGFESSPNPFFNLMFRKPRKKIS